MAKTLTSSKAKEILRHGEANKTPLSPKQKRYMGWVAGGKAQDGGWLKKYQDGGEVRDDVLVNIAPVAKQDATRLSVPLTKKVNQEKIDYYNPTIEKGITSGDKRVDFLYNNQWLFKVPVLNNYIKKAAKEIASITGLGRVDNIEEYKKLAKDRNLSYSGGWEGAEMVDQFFDQDKFPKSKYTPTSDFLSFLPSYSLKDNFKNISKPERDRNLSQFISRTLKPIDKEGPKEIKYEDFIENKEPIYDMYPTLDLHDLGNPDLGGYKAGMAWDRSVNLPYVSIADAWDFDPEHYSKVWSYGEPEEKRQRTKIQATLMQKAGHPFKIYDRFYFDPETKEYISDDSIQSLKHESGITPLEDEAMNKDISEYFPDNKKNGGQLKKSNQLRTFTRSRWLDKYK